METITSDEELTQAGFYWREIDGVRALVCAPLEQDAAAAKGLDDGQVVGDEDDGPAFSCNLSHLAQ